jgi:hypothetical protein
MWPLVQDARYESGRISRAFYDLEREERTGQTERHRFYLEEYKPDWFQQDMDVVRPIFSEPFATDDDMAEVVAVAAKQVDNGGRKTMLRAVESDPQVLGWARVEGGAESCAFCTMLISRGPMYGEAHAAGLDADTTTAVEVIRQAEESGDDEIFDALMTRWHPHCDCRVVPVFDRSDWPGRDQYLAASKLWGESTKGTSGVDSINALRRAINANKKDGQAVQPATRPAAA